MAAAAAAARAAEKFECGALSAGSDDAAAGGGNTFRNDGRDDGVDDRGCSAEAPGAADRAECRHVGSVDAGLRYGSRSQACEALSGIFHPPRHQRLKRKKQRLPVESIWYDVLS